MFARTTYLLFAKKIEPDFPFWADELAEPHPDMNIKVAAFTVSQKSYNTKLQFFDSFTIGMFKILQNL